MEEKELLEVGTKVVVTLGNSGDYKKVGQIIEVDKKDDNLPYYIQYEDQFKLWEEAESVQKYDARKKVYLAGPFFSETQIDIVNELHEALLKNPTIKDIFVPMDHQMNDGDIEEFTPEWARLVAMNDYKHVEEADIVVAIVDFDGQDMDSGTAVEIGYAYATNKPVYLFHKENHEDMVNLMATEVAQAYFKSSQQIEKYDFIKSEKIPFSGNYR